MSGPDVLTEPDIQEVNSYNDIRDVSEKTKSRVTTRTEGKSHGQPSRTRFFRSPGDPSIASLQGLDRLINEQYLFIHRTGNEFDGDYIDSSHIYDILNSAGERVFSAVKTFQYENCDRLLQLDVCILECEGGGILSIKGDSATISVCTLSFAGDLEDELGRILNRKDGCCSRQELDVELQGIKRFHITRSPGKGKGDFEIVWVEGHVHCGRTSQDWTSWFDVSSPIRDSHYGVGFSEGLDVNHKALLMAAMIFLYFESYDSVGELRRGSLTFDRICCLIFGILFVFIIIFLSIIAILRSVYSEF